MCVFTKRWQRGGGGEKEGEEEGEVSVTPFLFSEALEAKRKGGGEGGGERQSNLEEELWKCLTHGSKEAIKQLKKPGNDNAGCCRAHKCSRVDHANHGRKCRGKEKKKQTADGGWKKGLSLAFFLPVCLGPQGGRRGWGGVKPPWTDTETFFSSPRQTFFCRTRAQIRTYKKANYTLYYDKYSKKNP